MAFFVISFLYGGGKFRWFGEKAEEAGKYIRQNCDILAGVVDKIKKKKESAEETAKKVKKTIDAITGANESDHRNQ